MLYEVLGSVIRGAGAMGAAPVAQIVRGQHRGKRGKRLPFLQEQHFKRSMLLTWIYVEDCVFKQFIEI